MATSKEMLETYKKLVNDLDEKIPGMETLVESSESELTTIKTNFASSVWSFCSGTLTNTFNSKNTIYETRAQTLVDYYSGMLASVKAKRDEAKLQQDAYAELVRQEEEAERLAREAAEQAERDRQAAAAQPSKTSGRGK